VWGGEGSHRCVCHAYYQLMFFVALVYEISCVCECMGVSLFEWGRKGCVVAYVMPHSRCMQGHMCTSVTSLCLSHSVAYVMPHSRCCALVPWCVGSVVCVYARMGAECV